MEPLLRWAIEYILAPVVLVFVLLLFAAGIIELLRELFLKKGR